MLDQGILSFNEGDSPFYVMRYYAATLRDLIKAGISRERVLPLFSQILDGVEAAHLKNVWHRDLKPENILYDQTTESYLVADFGIAHFGEEELYTLVETRAHDRLANFQYAAPEQRARGRKVDNRADIYALGLILNELFTGEVPQGAGFKRIGDVSPEYSYLDDLIHEMIQQDPENRTASIQAIKLQVIGRGKEFVRLQELNKLKTTVIPETTIDDPIIHRPVELVGIDYSAGMLRLKLNQAPGVAWIRTFSGMGYTAAISGKEPSRFSFLQDEAEIPVNTQDAQFVVNHFKNYLREANRLYVTGIENARRHQIEQRNRELQESLKRAEEERKTRETILKTIKF